MAFKTFDRKLFIQREATEGTYALGASYAAANYIETTEPTWTVTNRTVERNPTRGSITQVPLIAAGTSATAPSAMVEFSFSVELNGSGTKGTPPRWGELLKACGFDAADGFDSGGSPSTARALWEVPVTGGNLTGTAAWMLHKENLSAQTLIPYAPATRMGRVIGDLAYDDGTLYYVKAGSALSVADTDNVTGSLSNALTGTTFEADEDGAASGCAWFPVSGQELGGTGASSLSMAFVINQDAGAPPTASVIVATGCRGNVEFVFQAGDRVLMNFTFMGRMYAYDEGIGDPAAAEGRPIPPAFVGAGMTIQDSSAGATNATAVPGLIFDALTLNMNNELAVRQDVNHASGYGVCHITGRNPQLTWNPDAVLDATYPFWDRFLIGETSRTRLDIGTTSGNKFLFKMPAIQFTGIADGNRDEVQVYDTTSTLTGGEYGSSVEEVFDDASTVASVALNDKMGVDNEIVLYQL